MIEEENIIEDIEQEVEQSDISDEESKFSEYFKCDLHIHTDYSSITKDNDYKGKFDLKKIIEKISEPKYNIKLFSFTDHNIINYPVYEEYYSDKTLNTADRCLLVGVEIDIILEKYLFKKLESNIDNSKCEEKKYHSLIIFKSTNARELNGKLDSMYEKIANEYNEKNGTSIDLNKENIKCRITSFNRFVEAFIDEDYIVISHGKKEANIVEAYKSYDVGMNEAQVMVLLGIINAVEMSPGSIPKVTNYFNAGFQSLLTEDFSAKKEVPYVVFSDNHQIDYYPKHDKDQKLTSEMYTWLKGDLSFETLRMSFVDPISRIIVSSSEPKCPDKYIEEVVFETQCGEKTKKQKIALSPGINTIVGGRSSGKSLLFNSILYSLTSGRSKSKTDDYTKDSNKVLKPESIKSKLNCELEFKDDNICEIDAFTQEEIIQLFENNGVGLKDHLPFKKIDINELNTKKSDYSLKIDEFTNSYADFLNKKNDYSISLPSNTFKVASKEIIEKYVYKEVLESLKSDDKVSSDDIINIINKLKTELLNLETIKELKLKNNLIFNEDELEVINSFIKMLNKKTDHFIELYNITLIKEKFFVNLSSSLDEIANKYINAETAKISNAKEILKNSKIKAYEYFKAKMMFKHCSSNLENSNICVEEKNNQISESYTLNTKVDSKIDKDFLASAITEKIHDYDRNKTLENNFIDLLNDNIKIYRKNNTAENVNWVFSHVKNLINNSLMPKYTIIEKDNDILLNSDNMSQGKKASIYLEIILESSKSKNSIIMIDQPEDNIDNEFITDVLIDKIRDLRMNNQVILVTHNAAIAINSDSENIIISENKDGVFKYEIGGLENIKHRKKICKLLDGGNYIFDNRYHKYNIINNKVCEPIRKGEIYE